MSSIQLDRKLVLERKDDDKPKGTIHAIDTCIRKPLLIAAVSDGTVRIWNFKDGHLRICKTFHEEPRSVSFHPSGMHAIVGFSDKLRIVHVLADDLRPCWEASVKCRECHFSRGGQAFAAAHGQLITVFDFYRETKLCDLRGHNAKVCRFIWSHFDAGIISSDEDGHIFRWDVKSGRRVGEHIVQCGNTNACYTSVSNETIWSINHNNLEVIAQKNLAILKTFSRHEQGNKIVGPILASNEANSMVFVGVCPGDYVGLADTIRVYNAIQIQEDYIDFPFSETITIMQSSHDDRYLLVLDATGNITVFEVNDQRGFDQVLITTTQEERSKMHFEPCKNVLISETRIEEQQAIIDDLKGRVEEMKTENSYQISVRKKAHIDTLCNAKQSFLKQAKERDWRHKQLETKKAEMQQQHKERINQIDCTHEKDMTKIELRNRDKILAEVDNYQQATSNWDLQRKNWDRQKQSLVGTHKKCYEDLKQELGGNLQNHTNLKIDLTQQVDDLKKTLNESKRQLEEDIDTEDQQFEKKYKQKLALERDIYMQYAGENGILHKKVAAALTDIEDEKEIVKVKLLKEEGMGESISLLHRDIDALRRTINSKDEEISSKDITIRCLQKKQQELHKFKFVLDDKIREYESQMKPRDVEAVQMREQIEKLAEALKHYFHDSECMEALVLKIKLQIEQQQQVVTKNKKKMSSQDTFFRCLLGGLDDCTQLIQKPDELVIKVHSICALIKPESSETDKIDYSTSHSELKTQLDRLQQQLCQVKQSKEKILFESKHENNAARKANKDLLDQVRALTCSNRKARQEIRKQQYNFDASGHKAFYS